MGLVLGCYSLEVTPKSRSVVPEVLDVHVIPSDEVRMVPESPIVTKVLFPKVTSSSISEVPEVLDVHVIPSGEVRMVPAPSSLSPTAMNILFA